MKSTRFIIIAAALFIFLFAYTGLNKLLLYDVFYMDLGKSPLIGRRFATPVAIIIPTLEVATAVALIIPRFRLKGFYAAFGLMSLFTLYVGYMLLFRVHRPCTCGGIIREMSWPVHLIFNIVFTILAYISIRIIRRDPDQKPSRFSTVAYS